MRALFTLSIVFLSIVAAILFTGATVEVTFPSADGISDSPDIPAVDDLTQVPVLEPEPPTNVLPDPLPVPTEVVPASPVVLKLVSNACEPDRPWPNATFDGRPLKQVKTLTVVATAYCPCKVCCGPGAKGITASGYSVYTNGYRLAAADPKVLPLRSIITIPGYRGGVPVQVLDTGGAIKGNRIDVLFKTHGEARAWGVRKLTIKVWDYAK